MLTPFLKKYIGLSKTTFNSLFNLKTLYICESLLILKKSSESKKQIIFPEAFFNPIL